MPSRNFLALALACAAAVPAVAQDRPAMERETRVFTYPRAIEALRGPRAVLGITTDVGNGLADTAGVLVDDVLDGGPAARAGIQEGARLTAIDGVDLRISPADAEDPTLAGLGSRRLTRELGKRNPGDEVELRVASGNQSRAVRVRLADADSLRPRAAAAPRMRLREAREPLASRASLGVSVGSTGSRRDTLGIFVMGVDEEGPAARAGIIEGHRIAAINGVDLRVNRADVEDPMVGSARVQQLTRTLRDVKPGDEVELRVWQDGRYRTVRVRTVPADSLRRSRGMTIIGGGPGRFLVGPGMFEEIDVILDGALRRARAIDRDDIDIRPRGRLH